MIAIVKQLIAHAIKRFTFLITLFLPILTNAQDVSKSVGDWTYNNYGDKNNSCIIYSQSMRSKGYEDQENRLSYIYVLKKANNEYSLGISPGYNVDSHKGLILEINRKAYILNVVLPDYAWTFSSNQDVTLINEMIMAEDSLKVRSYGGDDIAVLDYFSLNGFASAMKELNKCNLNYH